MTYDWTKLYMLDPAIVAILYPIVNAPSGGEA